LKGYENVDDLNKDQEKQIEKKWADIIEQYQNQIKEE